MSKATKSQIAAGATSPPAIELLEGTPPPDADGNATAEFVESEVVAENRRLREEVERLTAELREQDDAFSREWTRRERELTTRTPRDRRPRRAVFDASVPGVDADGRRVTFAPGDPVPDHIDPAGMPAGAVRFVED